ncbi:MAG: HNH endonuclease [Rubrivivax sp.]|nr:HNH endonuclease [Rubrivivax sp.]
MRFWVGVTDRRWFEFLRARHLDEVNFWQPSAKPMFSSIEPGTPFFFKLKRPLNHIGGYGTFVSFVRLPLSLAWESFGEKNGAATLREFESLIRGINPRAHEPDPEIGCALLAKPVFFGDDALAVAPSDWSSNIVRGKTYSDSTVQGDALLDLVSPERMDKWGEGRGDVAMEPDAPRYAEPFLARARLGQGTFRALITDAYSRRCAVTGENIVPVLEAAHIRPFSEEGPSRLCNGLLLRSDFHKLFDLGYVTVTPDLRVEVSRTIREEWFNGKAYYRVHGSKLRSVPQQPWSKPGPEFLRWHNENRYRS